MSSRESKRERERERHVPKETEERQKDRATETEKRQSNRDREETEQQRQRRDKETETERHVVLPNKKGAGSTRVMTWFYTYSRPKTWCCLSGKCSCRSCRRGTTSNGRMKGIAGNPT